MKKRTIAFALAFILIICCLPQFTLRTFAADISGKFGENLTWNFHEAAGTLTINGSGMIPTFDNPWESFRDRIRSVVISKGVTGIGANAFAFCRNLTQVKIPDTVTLIGGSAFTECESLTSVTIPGSVKTVGEGAFVGCHNLKRVEIQKGAGQISFYAFDRCAGLQTVIILEPRLDLSSDAFINCNATFYGYPGSTAQSYAESEGNPFIPIDQKTGFADVRGDSYYGNAVVWAVENNITNGLDSITFGPDAACTRGQVVTFLWRAAGCPEPERKETPFADVKPGAFYEKAVAWAVEKNITSGMSKTSFAPDRTCTRGQIVTFLWRYAGTPAPTSIETQFTDTVPKAFYETAVAWAVENKITTGVKDTRFAPDDTCTRAQVVTFLFRAVKH